MQDRLSKLVAIFENLDFRANHAEGDDLLGDAYEYLMRHFATESGKSKGQFYTPAEVSRIMAKVIGIGLGHLACNIQSMTPLAAPVRCFLKPLTKRCKRHHHLWPGEGQRHLCTRADEHVSARQSDRRHLVWQHTVLPHTSRINTTV